MSLQFYLIPNQMTETEDDYRAVSKSQGNYTVEDVYDRVTRQGSTVTKAEALASQEEMTEEIIKLLLEGNSISTPLVNISAKISGVFNGSKDTFDASRHKIRLSLTPGIRLREVAARIPLQKIKAQERKPELLEYHDNASETVNEVITPGRGTSIEGALLKFDEADENQGIFYIKTGDGSETRVAVPILRNMPGELIFNAPELDAGEYKVEVRAILKNTKQLRTGTLSTILTVE